MSYRLIDANDLAQKYPEVNDMPCIYADLPNGLDGKGYDVVEWDEPCDDCISRKATAELIGTRLYESAYNNVGYTCEADKVFADIAENRLDLWLSELPSVTPTRKKGKWITELGIGCKCSECGKPPYPYQTDSSSDDYWKPDYCPNCGAKMESEG